MDSMNEKGRRQELREVDRRYLVFYLRVYDGMSSKILGHLVDISEKGMMLIADNAIPVNENYRLRMRLPAQITGKLAKIFPVRPPGIGRQPALDRDIIQKSVHQMLHSVNITGRFRKVECR